MGEMLQEIAGQILSSPILRGVEERLAWVEEAYAKATQVVAKGANRLKRTTLGINLLIESCGIGVTPFDGGLALA